MATAPVLHPSLLLLLLLPLLPGPPGLRLHPMLLLLLLTRHFCCCRPLLTPAAGRMRAGAWARAAAVARDASCWHTAWRCEHVHARSVPLLSSCTLSVHCALLAPGWQQLGAAWRCTRRVVWCQRATRIGGQHHMSAACGGVVCMNGGPRKLRATAHVDAGVQRSSDCGQHLL
jgi:hypothetical protein